MCGIVGYVEAGRGPDQGRMLLDAMATAIAHRGPDDSGSILFADAGLAMRRLSIVDLAGGHQPMASPDGRFSIVFNGEIYNHAELRPQLAARGWNFKTGSDTEVLLANWILDGPAGLTRLNGMFAFAVWDADARRMTLVRDRMGVKPLYYAWRGGQLAFASEIKGLVADQAFDRVIDPQALWDYLTFRYVPGPRTIWQGVWKLPPGHWLEVVPGGEPLVRRWWDIPYPTTPIPCGAEALQAEFDQLFTDAVRLRMLADVPVGIMLSGGLDSSAVAAAAVESGLGAVEAFSVAFADSPDMDETPYAASVADALGLVHHRVVIGEREFLDFLPTFVRGSDEPLADLASVPLYYVSALARRSVKAALSGEGADEILAGYDFDRVVAGWEAACPAPSGWRRILGGRRADPLAGPVPPHMTNYMDSAAKTGLLRSGALFPDSLDRVRDALARCGSDEPLHRMLYAYCQDWLVEDLLMKADKMSMAASLEMRTPFLDYRLVEWAARAPAAVKVGRTAGGGWQTKAVLRHYASRRLPPSVVSRPKQGFPVPVYGWLSNVLRPWAADLLGGGGRLAGWLDPKGIAQALDRGTMENAAILDQHRLWNLLVLELWLREWSPRC